MRKAYQMILALMLLAIGATSAKAQDLVSLQQVPFCTWDGFGADAKSTGDAGCAWELNKPTGLPYGDGSVLNYCDLSSCTKLVITATAGTPRILMNREEATGNWNADEAQSKMIEYPRNEPDAWSNKYFSKEEKDGATVYTVDLKQIVADKGFAHLHCVKGAYWADVTVTSMEVDYKAAVDPGVDPSEGQTVDLEAEMFKAWTSDQPGAQVDNDPAPEPKSNDPFACTYDLFKNVGAYGTIYGSPNVYCLWYADLTGTKTMTVTGTPGMDIRVMMNRVPYVEGGSGDADGGAYVELVQKIGEDGTTVFDFTKYEYVHLNAIKVPGGGTAGVVKAIQLFGSVKAVSGWVDLLNNGDVTGDDLESFPVSKDGPNNGNTANDRPENVTLDGVKCLKVTADDLTNIAEEWTTWSTQFYMKLSEFLPEGTQWRAEFDVYASENANITTSAQGAPRAWQAGNFFPAFDVWADWQHKEFEGTVSAGEAGENGLGSIAFDLNNSNKPIDFYFKNLHFYIYKEKNALGQLSAGFQADVVSVDLGENANMKDLVKASGNSRLIYPVDCAEVKVNGNPTTLLSVEGHEDGKLYIFIDEGYSEDENDVVEVSFTNPADEAYRLKFIAGRWEGTDVPDFSGLIARYTDGLGENVSYMAEAPTLKSTDPEKGSFNLPLTLKTFKAVFATEANCEKIVAKFDNETLTVSPATGFAKEFTFTRTSDGDIAAGQHTLTIDKVYPVSEILGDDEFGTYNIPLSFGPVVIDPNDQPKDLIPASYFSEAANNGIPAGFKVIAGGEERVAPNTYGTGARVFSFAEGGDFVKGLYYRDNYVSYGEYEDYLLPLEAGKAYDLHFNTARWKSSGQWTKFQIIAPDGETVEYEEVIENNPDTNGGTGSPVKGSTAFDKSFEPATTGNYTLKWICASNSAGDQGGYNENLLANVYMRYVPNIPGYAETLLLNAALEKANNTLSAYAVERYAGVDYDALKALVEKIEAEMSGYTAPSVYNEMAAALDNAVQTLVDHKTACDNYDAAIKKTCDIVRQVAAAEDNGKPNEKQKFLQTELYANVKDMAEKYHGTSEWQNLGTEEEPNYQLVYSFDVLTENAELAAATTELNNINNLAGSMFTVGESKTGTTGYAALNDRIRKGIATLKAIGVAEDDNLIVEASKELGDNDDVADAIKSRIKTIVYGKMKDAENDLFAVDANGIPTTVDMTVFVKNPNLYVTKANRKDLTTDNAPGWTIVEGAGYDVSWTTGWSQVGNDQIPADAMMSNYNKDYVISQEITDLPAGVYNVIVGYGERENETAAEGCFFFTASSASTDSTKINAPVIGQTFPYANLTAENIVVTDGKLLVGVSSTSGSHTFFNEVKLALTAPAAGFDYASAYTELVNSIDAQVAPAQVRAIQIFDLNGRQISTAKKGVAIVKKLMSDGTIRTEKVVVK